MRMPVKKVTKKTTPKKTSKSKNMNAATVLKPAGEVLCRKNPDGGVSILHLGQDDVFYALDGVSAEFWSLLNGRDSIASITDRLKKKYNPPAGQIEKDVKKLVEDLMKEELVSITD